MEYNAQEIDMTNIVNKGFFGQPSLWNSIKEKDVYLHSSKGSSSLFKRRMNTIDYWFVELTYSLTLNWTDKSWRKYRVRFNIKMKRMSKEKKRKKHMTVMLFISRDYHNLFIYTYLFLFLFLFKSIQKFSIKELRIIY